MEYKILPLVVVEKYVPLMDVRGVSAVARSPRGFLTAFREARGRITALSQGWRTEREGFIARHLAQIKIRKEALFGKDGLPTRRHLALIAWAYSPVPNRL